MTVTLTDTSATLVFDRTEGVFLIVGLHVGLAHEDTGLSEEARAWCLALIQDLRLLFVSTDASTQQKPAAWTP